MIDVSRELFISLGAPGLFAVAFLEFFLLPVPPDMVLIPLALATPEFALVYAAIATAGSVLAGTAGYTIGRRGGRPVLESRFSDERIRQGERYFERYGLATVGIGAFAPIPEGYELLSITAGVVKLDVRLYLLASLAGRGGRYVLEAVLVLALGDAVAGLDEPGLYAVIGAVALVVLAGYLLRHWWSPRVRRPVD